VAREIRKIFMDALVRWDACKKHAYLTVVTSGSLEGQHRKCGHKYRNRTGGNI
jgi:hypothetical protein